MLVTPDTLQGNPYLDSYLAVDRMHPPLEQWRRYRNTLSGHYAFGVPTPAALAEIARYAPIIEIGAGGGYWARLLRDLGVDILAYDIRPPGNVDRANRWYAQWTPWTEISLGGAPMVAAHPDRTLFLCWPLWNVPVASNSVRWYEGDVVLYVGEGYRGSTGDPAFHELLDRDFTLETTVPLPLWPDRFDSLTVWRRTRRRPLRDGGLFGSMFVGSRDQHRLGHGAEWRRVDGDADEARGGDGAAPSSNGDHPTAELPPAAG